MMFGKALAFLLLVASADGVTEKDLQGLWRGNRYTEGKGEGAGVKIEILFKGGALVGTKGNSSLGEATFTIAADGRSIDATGTTAGYRGKTYQGILKLEGDTLLWCCSGNAAKDQKRPTDFAANPGSAHYLLILTRAK